MHGDKGQGCRQASPLSYYYIWPDELAPKFTRKAKVNNSQCCDVHNSYIFFHRAIKKDAQSKVREKKKVRLVM